MRGAICIIALLLAVPPVFAQQVTALVSESTVGMSEVVRYTVEIQGIGGSDINSITPPEADGLELIQRRPSTQSNVSITGTSITRTLSYTWALRPLREGTVRILATTVQIGGEEYSTEPVQLVVVPQTQRNAVGGRSGGGSDPFGVPQSQADPSRILEEGIYIQAVANTNRAYQNAQVLVDYDLYYRRDLNPRNSRLADSWDAEGFWREELDVETATSARTAVINGIRYNVVRLKRVAVFPTRIGDLTVDPLRISTEVVAPRQRSDPFSIPFLNLGSLVSVERSSTAVDIESIPLPAGSPAAFSGAVGAFTLQATLSREEIEVGEPVQLTVSIVGSGNIAMLEAPAIDPPHVFERYDPEVQTSINREGAGVSGYKRFVYLLVPRSNGSFEIPPIEFAYFNPEEEDYVRLSASTPAITVSGSAAGSIASGTTNAGFPVDDITRPLPASPWVTSSVSQLHKSACGYIALIIPLLLYGLLYTVRRRTTRLAMDTAYARQQKANPLARKRLKRARQLLKDGDPKTFFEELERAVLGFIGNRLNVHELGMTRSQLEAVLHESGIAEEARQKIAELLVTCDTGRFAPVESDAKAREDAYEEASRLIVMLDATFREA